MARSHFAKIIHRTMNQVRFAKKREWSQSQLFDAIFSRRDFLKGSAAIAAPLAFGLDLDNSENALKKPPTKPSKGPVLILGAGLAGLSAAYTLKKAKIPFRILEASPRVGGRVLTRFHYNSDDQFVELGAELVDTNNHALISLAKELGLETQSLVEEDEQIETELFDFEGVLRTHKDLVEAVAPAVEIIQKAKAGGAEGFTYLTANPKRIKWDKMNLLQFLDSMKDHVDRWVIEALRVAYVGEMGREADEQSMINMVNQIGDDVADGFELFGRSDESLRIQGGNGLLIEKLFEAINKGVVPVETSTKVVAIKKRNGRVVVISQNSSKTTEHVVERVICTLPFSTLREVEGLTALELSSAKLDCIRNCFYGQNSKVALEFRQRFWTESVNKRVHAFSGAIYSDQPSQSFWEASRSQEGGRGLMMNFLGGKASLTADNSTLEKHALPDLQKIFERSKDMYIRGLAQNWNQMPFVKGSYMCLGPGHYARFHGAEGEPELGGQILFAGEHTSYKFMGFMNGAVESGIRAAQAIIGHDKIRSMSSEEEVQPVPEPEF